MNTPTMKPTSNIEHRTLNSQSRKPKRPSFIRRSMFDVQRSMFPQNFKVRFANSALRTSHSTFLFANDLALGHDGWAQLAPFGDFPGQAMLRNADGSITQFPAIQRLDRAAADMMVAKFKSPWNRVKRYFTGCQIYAGHPDVPALANEHPDRTPKGMIVDLQARANGLFCKPVFTREGSELVETRKLRAFSPYWTASEIGEQPGADGKPVKIFRPEHLNSAGLTNNPNLPVQLLNEKRENIEHPISNAEHRIEDVRAPIPHSAFNVGRSAFDVQPTVPALNPQHSSFNHLMNKQLILDFLATQGMTLANEATDEQIAAALQQLGERTTIAETTFASQSLELETARAELANERQFHADTLLDSALIAGRITAAQRPEWAARLQTDFANASAALAQLAPTLKTTALTLNFGARKAEIANAPDRRDALDTLVKAEMAVNGGDYDRAFATVQKANPALFAAMKKPAQ
ncbi:MAG TPA: phage protease [Verrucomicrobiae bacterium]|nr:phage protease [Verrucomicrobiae bacterium]